MAEALELAGRLTGSGHELRQRVYFEDTDFSGLVYHARYLHFFERGRSDFLRLLGNDHQALLAGADGAPAAFVVRRMKLDFRKPARIDDVLEVTIRLHSLSAAILTLDQVITREGIILFEAQVEVVLISLDGKPQRLSQRLRDLFAPAE